MKHLRVITWARWTVKDPFSSEHYSIFTASILRPSWEYPIACASMAISKGRYKVFMRLLYEDLGVVFNIPKEYRERLERGYKQAVIAAGRIQEQQKAVHNLANLPPGTRLVRTDTGEIIAEAERILNGDS